MDDLGFTIELFFVERARWRLMFGLELAVKNICFFFGCSVDPGRGDCPSRNESEKSTAGSAGSMRGSSFFPSSDRSDLWVCGICFFFSFLRTVSPIGVPGFIYSGIASYLSWNTGKGTALGIYLGGVVFCLY